MSLVASHILAILVSELAANTVDLLLVSLAGGLECGNFFSSSAGELGVVHIERGEADLKNFALVEDNA